jgi:hypothetical protein
MTTAPLRYTVGTVRAAGLDARWTKTNAGAPIIAARRADVGGGMWYVLDREIWGSAQKVGLATAFEQHCALGKYFSIPA